ncbi:Uncharacterised protein [Chlamydia trachomatis]|nr:Uncharacterised protein [Chlamydia trachomatis]
MFPNFLGEEVMIVTDLVSSNPKITISITLIATAYVSKDIKAVCQLR